MSAKNKKELTAEEIAVAKAASEAEKAAKDAAKAAAAEARAAKVPLSADDWGRFYAAEPKETVYIPIEKTNKDDVVVPVCLNGYIYKINRGVDVAVPQSVAEVLRNAGYIH